MLGTAVMSRRSAARTRSPYVVTIQLRGMDGHRSARLLTEPKETTRGGANVQGIDHPTIRDHSPRLMCMVEVFADRAAAAFGGGVHA